MARNYECSLIINPALNEADLAQELTACEEIIKQQGGTISNKSIPRKIELGYVIQKKKEGVHTVIDFTIDPAHIITIQNALRLRESILRFMFVVKENQAATSGQS